MEGYRFGLTLVLLVGLSTAEVIRTQKCYLPAASQSTCAIHEVRLDPCPEASANKPCKIKLGQNATISFDYTPSFSATSMGSHAYKVNSLVDTAFESMDTNGCKYTTCPVEANKKQVYVYSLDISKQFPVGVYQSKLKLWNQEDRSQQCCFKLTVELEN